MNTQRITVFFTILLFFCCLGACKRVRPDAPEQEAFDPPIPDPVSYMAGHLTFPVRDLEAKINRSLGRTLVPEETFEGHKGEAWRFRVERTGPVKIRYANRKVYFSAPLQVWYTNPIGLRKSDERKSRTLCALSVTFNSPVGVGSTWRLATQSRFEEYQWLKEPNLKLLGINVSVRKIAEKILDKRKNDIERAIDKAVYNGLRLDREVSKIWRDMQNPLRIAKVPENFWLLPQPFSIAVAPVYGNSTQITVPIQIAFRVKTHLGPRPMVDSLIMLPRLLRRNSLPDSARIEVLGFIPYSDVNAVLARTLTRQKLSLAGGTITIKKAMVYGSGRQLILKADIGGKVNGALFFHGNPAYDTLTNTLRMNNVDFDVDTKERLLSTADWLLHDHLRDTIQAAMNIPLRQQISSLPGKIETAFAKAKVGRKTDLTIDTFRLIPQRIVIQPEGVQVLIRVKSKVAVKVKRF